MTTADQVGPGSRPAPKSGGGTSAMEADLAALRARVLQPGDAAAPATNSKGSPATAPIPSAAAGESAVTEALPASLSSGGAIGAPATTGAPAAAKGVPGPLRRVRLTVSRIDPWSAMKVSFLLSVALGIAMVVMTAVLWMVLAGMGVFDQVNTLVGSIITDGEQKFDIFDFVGFGKVVSLSIVIGVIDVILMTAIATLAAFLYNLSSSLVGGVQLTLTDD